MNQFHTALTLAATFAAADLYLAPMPQVISTNTQGGEHYAELTPTGVILLYATGRPRSLDLYDSCFATIGARRVAIEPDGHVTVFTYRVQ